MDILEIRDYLVKNEGFVPFTKIHSTAYAGAESFKNGSSPIIKETERFDIIFDGSGLSFESEDDVFCFDIVKS